MFRIWIQPTMLRTLWYFQHWYVQRMSSIDLLAGWGGSSGTGAQVLKLLCPPENHSPKMQPAVPLWNITVVFHRLPHLRLFISNCGNGFHFWWSGQWPVSRHLRPSGWTGTSPPVSHLQWYGMPQNFVPRVNSFLGSHNDEKVTGKVTSRVVNTDVLCRWTLDFSESYFFIHYFSSSMILWMVQCYTRAFYLTASSSVDQFAWSVGIIKFTSFMKN